MLLKGLGDCIRKERIFISCVGVPLLLRDACSISRKHILLKLCTFLLQADLGNFFKSLHRALLTCNLEGWHHLLNSYCNCNHLGWKPIRFMVYCIGKWQLIIAVSPDRPRGHVIVCLFVYKQIYLPWKREGIRSPRCDRHWRLHARAHVPWLLFVWLLVERLTWNINKQNHVLTFLYFQYEQSALKSQRELILRTKAKSLLPYFSRIFGLVTFLSI